MKGVRTVGIFWNRGGVGATRPPRALVTGFDRGASLGRPGDESTHRAVLRQAIAMLAHDAPCTEKWG